jgi:predicted DNA-binding protein with PD1-like motif
MQVFRGATAVEYVAVRLDAGEDVIEGLNRAVTEAQIQAGSVITAVGTLAFFELEVPATLAYPSTIYSTKNQGPGLIINAQGHIVNGVGDLHLTVVRRNELHAGKVMTGTKVLHTVELTILRAGNVRWWRVPHPQTGVPVFQSQVAQAPGTQLTLMGRPLDPGAISLVPKRLMQQHQCVPVAKTQDTLVVAMVDANNPFAIDDLRAATGLRIQAVQVPAKDLHPVLSTILGSN